jgi:hypothetical protein
MHSNLQINLKIFTAAYLRVTDLVSMLVFLSSLILLGLVCSRTKLNLKVIKFYFKKYT